MPNPWEPNRNLPKKLNYNETLSNMLQSSKRVDFSTFQPHQQQMDLMQHMLQLSSINPPNTTPTTPTPDAPLEERFRDQLTALRDMGFTNDEKNKRALLASSGNTEMAVAYLLDLN